MQWKFIVFFFLYFCSGKCAWYTKIDYRYRKRKRIKYIALWCLCKKKFSDLRCTFSDRIFEDYATVHLTFFNLMIWIGVVGSPSGSGCPFWFQIQLCSGGIEFRTIDWSSFSYIPGFMCHSFIHLDWGCRIICFSVNPNSNQTCSKIYLNYLNNRDIVCYLLFENYSP